MEPDSDPVLITTISLLPTTHLEDLDLDLCPPSTPIHSALSEVIQRLGPRFKRLTTEFSLSDAAWEHLAFLPDLGSFVVSGTPCTEISGSVPHETTFPALKCMKIKVNDAHHHWLFLFSLLKSSPLQKITVETHHIIRNVDVPIQVTTAVLGAELHRSINALVLPDSTPPISRFSHTLHRSVPSKR